MAYFRRSTGSGRSSDGFVFNPDSDRAIFHRVPGDNIPDAPTEEMVTIFQLFPDFWFGYRYAFYL